MKNKLIILMLVWQSASFAGINIAEKSTEPERKQKKNTPLTEKKVPRVKSTTQQFEIEGYANSVYVRFVVDVVNNKRVSGLMFHENGVSSYVYGDIVNGVLHIYDSKGLHFTVIVAN